MPTRRTKVSVPIPSSANGSALDKTQAYSTSTSSPSRRSPFLPTTLESLLIAIYPGTLLLGSLFSILNAKNRNAPYSAVSQSHPAHAAPSYFARKSNVFNVYFVKVGWFWITLAFALFLFSHSSLGPRGSLALTRRRARALTRYALVTTWWTLMTQWCFGAPLIDRGFRYTGGQCEIIYADTPAADAKRESMSDAREALTHAACRLVGGEWKGGHDISGHVFILILGSAMLWFELLPAILRLEGIREERRIRMADGAVKSASVETEDRAGDKGNMEVPKELGVGVKAAIGVAALSWWMLLMTAAYFHTWFEKATGLLVAFAALWVVYFLPRGVPAVRRVVGMPGV
ncbi:hypothetical protein LTR28_006634 [Elasticomyces elasticus]|nr:hypothetical protein LTR28_006634 [Elasticomyces elasticus]